MQHTHAKYDVKTAKVRFCNVGPNKIQCMNNRERFWQGVRHMQCKFSRRTIQHVMEGFLYRGTLKSAYFFIRIRKNCVYFGGFREVRILSDKVIMHFEGQDTQSSYHVDTKIA